MADEMSQKEFDEQIFNRSRVTVKTENVLGVHNSGPMNVNRYTEENAFIMVDLFRWELVSNFDGVATYRPIFDAHQKWVASAAERYLDSISDHQPKEWEVWTEGFAATGEHGTARLWGKFIAVTFKEAVEQAVHMKSAEGQLWNDLTLYDPERLTYWGCKFYDNAIDARKGFG